MFPFSGSARTHKSQPSNDGKELTTLMAAAAEEQHGKSKQQGPPMVGVMSPRQRQFITFEDVRRRRK